MVKALIGTLLATVLLAGCGGGVTADDNGNGSFVIRDASNNSQITTTAANPYQIVGETTTFSVYEGNYPGQFTGTVVEQNNSCFTVTSVGTLSAPAFAITAVPLASANPCISGTTLAVEFADSKGHSIVEYYALNGSIVLASSVAHRNLTTP